MIKNGFKNRHAKSLDKEISGISSKSSSEINDQTTLKELINGLDKKNNKLDSNKNRKNKKSSEIICPECGENIFINIYNYTIDLFGCKNNHCIKNILIKDFQNMQNKIQNKTICNFCYNKNNENEFYFCLSCKFTLCLLCLKNHNQLHKIINYQQKNYICLDHNEKFISYCNKCKKNICSVCVGKHSNHEIINFGKKIPQKDNYLKELKYFKVKLERFKSYLNELIMNINKTIENMEALYKIMENIINGFDSKNINYQNFKNINQIYDDLSIISEDINQIINEENIKIKIKNLLQIYKKMNNIEDDYEIENNTILIKYVINQNKVKIFGKEFVDNNKNFCKIIYENKEYNLSEYLQNLDKNKKILTITLKGINNIVNMSQMFYECDSLLSISNSSKCDTSNVTNMRSMFNGCSSLNELYGISKFDTSNVTDMYCMFYECSSLIFMPDISKWDTSKVKNMSGMFERCCSLIALPDISRWDTKNVTDFSSMFSKCSMLSFLPDISNWNISKVNDFYGMFDGCKKTLNIPEKFKNMS